MAWSDDEEFIRWMRESIPLYPTEKQLGSDDVKCPDCDGEGKIDLVFTIEDPCETCDGTGRVDPSE